LKIVLLIIQRVHCLAIGKMYGVKRHNAKYKVWLSSVIGLLKKIL
jgi:hypothetical protein